ncbi:MAG TPA: TlpA disulfide reductase family protein [Chitinophagaceae bacterium]|nr:TlpA disulfide reductase family protein [Chitinophagaceae bacterium]
MKYTRLVIVFIVSMLFFTLAKAQQTIPNIADPRLNFTAQDVNGDSVQLSSFKGKVFLLDFWASWCGPCRVSNRQLIKLYNKYKDKGFEILGVSLDDEKKDWVKAIGKDKVTWPQLISLGGWDAEAAIKWNIEAIPASFLVNQSGDVVAIDPEKNELEKRVKELLGF